MRNQLHVVAAAVLLSSVLAACGGGGSSLPSASSTPSAPATPATTPKQSVSFTLTVPPSSSNALRGRKYLPSQTQSFSVTETDNGGAPGAPVVQNTAPGTPGCTTGANGTTCSISIAANIGSDRFTVSAYDAPNAGGNMLASGTVVGTVAAGVANVFPLTLNAQVASIVLSASDAYPQVGAASTVYVQAKDAAGNIIVGTYNAPIALSVDGNATLSVSSLASSTANAVTLTPSASQTTPYAVNASVNSATALLKISPSSTIVNYNLGSSSLDGTGFDLIAGVDGDLYYTALGPTTCSNGFCNSTTGVVGQFNPNTGAFTELPLPGSGAVEPYQTADGTLWVPAPVGSSPAGAAAQVLKIAGGFTSANVTAITLPAPVSGRQSTPRAITQGADGNLYLTDGKNATVDKMPLTAATTADITTIPVPAESPVPGAPFYGGRSYLTRPMGIASGADGNLYIANFAFANASLMSLAPSTLAWTNIVPPYAPQNDAARFVLAGQDGNVYTSWASQCYGCASGLSSYSTSSGATTPIALPPQSQPDHLAGKNGQVAWADLAAPGFGTYDTSTHDVLLVPMSSQADFATQGGSVGYTADGIAYTPNGDLWLMGYGKPVGSSSLFMAHVIITGAWSVFPSTNISLYGTGANNAQLIALLESGNSGPFTVKNGACASLAPVAGTTHDFTIAGTAAGACSVAITDAHGRTKTITVGVTSTTGTIMSTHKGGAI